MLLPMCLKTYNSGVVGRKNRIPSGEFAKTKQW